MVSKHVFVGGLAAVAFIAAACGSSTTTATAPSATTSPVASSPSASPSAAPTVPVATGTTLRVAGTRLGKVIVNSSGRTVYLFAADKGTTSVCYGSCAQYWPPVLTTGAPQAGSGVNAALLGTTRRTDGTTQVTYAGHPLYYFVTDKKAGDVTGQGINGFGGPWYVVSPSGMQIR